jgi:4-hydroxy-tetrahydrodipicolinate reductase
MKIALIGYGKMGKAIEKIALERGHTIDAIVNSSNTIDEVDMLNCDVAIEFSTPELATKHIIHCFNKQIPIVVGTTAWHHELESIKTICGEENGSMIYAPNFSLGVNIFFELNKRLAELMSGNTDYSAEVIEVHHLQKLDSPSGTAIELAKGIIAYNETYNDWKSGDGIKPEVSDAILPITAIREPEVPGTHTVIYQSEIDSILMTHQAHSRKGFALGAVVAAEWIFGKKGVFTMSNVLNS